MDDINLMRLSNQEIINIIDFLRHCRPLSDASLEINKEIEKDLVDKIVKVLDTVPPVRQDTIDQLRDFLSSNQIVPSQEIAEKLLGHVIRERLK